MQASILRFDQFELDIISHELRKSGRAIKLEKLPMELLILLAENQGQLVTREQIIRRLWGDNVFVDTRQGINTAIRKIRVALKDDSENPRIVETLSGLGYRLICPLATPVPQVHDGASSNARSTSSSGASTPLTAAQVFSGKIAAHPRFPLLAATALLVLVSTLFWIGHRKEPRLATERRITWNSPEASIRAAIVSPDGKYVAYSDPTGLYVRAVASGEIRPWPLPADFRALPSSWFPDGIHLLVVRLEGTERTPSLWAVSLLGGEPREIVANATGGSVSPNGTEIVYLPGPRFGSELWLIDASGTNPRKLAEPDKTEWPISRGNWILPAVWSPTGRRIAYVERHGVSAPDPVEDSYSVRTRDPHGSDLHIILDNSQVRQALCWNADGRLIFSEREDPFTERSNQSLSYVRVDDTGRLLGKPQPLSHGQGRVGGLSVTSDGNHLLVWRVNTQPQAFIGDFDQLGRLKTPRRLTLDAHGNMADAWTSDSSAVLFVSNRNGNWKLFKQTVDQATAEVLVESRSTFLPRLSADGAQVLYLSYSKPEDNSIPVDLMRRPLAGGPPQLILQEKGITNFQCARAPSALCVFSKLQGDNNIFISFDPAHGVGRELYRTSNGFANWTLSPDGKQLAVYLDRHRFRFLHLETGLAEDVTIKDWPISSGDWSEDGKGVFMPSVNSDGTPVMLEVDPKGNTKVVFQGEINTSFDWLIQSPDGHRGLLIAEIPDENDIWMVEDF